MLQRRLIGRRGPARKTGPPAPPPAPKLQAPPVIAEPEPGVELAARQGDGLEVVLLWSRATGRLWVEVLHVFTGESFQVEADPARALDVYNHPFAYCLGGRESLAGRSASEVVSPCREISPG